MHQKRKRIFRHRGSDIKGIKPPQREDQENQASDKSVSLRTMAALSSKALQCVPLSSKAAAK